MNSILSQFVPYEQAVKLKELGFADYHMLGWYIKDDGSSFGKSFHLSGNKSFIYYQEHCVKAALFSQSFDWFRVEHGLSSYVRAMDSGRSYWKVNILNSNGRIKGYSDFGDTYESARLACLEKLIELVTEKKG